MAERLTLAVSPPGNSPFCYPFIPKHASGMNSVRRLIAVVGLVGLWCRQEKMLLPPQCGVAAMVSVTGRFRTLRHTILGLIVAFALPLSALAHGPNAVPDDPELLRQYQAGFIAYQQGDYEAARKKWSPLAGKGSSAAQLFIGFMYDNGQGVPKDDSLAADWYRKSAERDNMIAQVRLAIMYRDGRGVAEDRVKAWFWAGMAARKEDHMHRIGTALQRELKAVMTPRELAEAEKQLGERVKKH